MSLEEDSWSTGKNVNLEKILFLIDKMQISSIYLLWLSLVKSHNNLTSNLLLLAESDESRRMD